jgi:hypothetical protein
MPSTAETLNIQTVLLKSNELDLSAWIFERHAMMVFIEKGRNVPQKVISNIKKYKTVLLNLGIEESTLGLVWKLNCDIKKQPKSAQKCLRYYYDECKTAEKYLGDTVIKDTAVFASGEEIAEDCLTSFKKFIGQKGTAVVFTWHQTANEWQWIDTDLLKVEFKRFKKLVKDGKLHTQSVNNTVKELNGQKWYPLVIQRTCENTDICIGSVKLFKFFVSGLVYWFSKEINRNNMFEYLQR